MRQIRILTDNSVQLIHSPCRGYDAHIPLSMKISILNSNPHPIIHPCIQDFPKSLTPNYSIKIVPPSTDDFSNVIQSNPLESNDFLVLSTTSRYPSIYKNAIQTMELFHAQNSIRIIDTFTFQAGVVYLVREAHRLIMNNKDLYSIETRIREIVPHIYTLLCLPNLSYLPCLGILDPAQAIIGEMMELFPIFSLEDGHLFVLDKLHSYKKVIDYFINYVSEFSRLKRVMIIHNQHSLTQEFNTLSEYIRSRFNPTIISESSPSIPLIAMFGPEVFGMIVIENT